MAYSSNVFLNCPFDNSGNYRKIREAIIFTVYDCGFFPRCALEEINSGDVRINKIMRMISESKFGIHDISMTELDRVTNLPRFNMPLELGIFLGAQRFGLGNQQKKNCLILDKEPYRYQKFISDISGQEVCSHGGDPHNAIGEIRSWLIATSRRRTIPSKQKIVQRYKKFRDELPIAQERTQMGIKEMTYIDYSAFVSEWLGANES